MNINPFESREVEFVFQLPLELAVENLRRTVGDPKEISTEGMVGSVSRDDCYIYRGVPRTRNSFRPTFYGSFATRGTETVLSGTISLNRVIRKFMVLWLGLVAVVAVVTLITLIKNPAASWTSLLHVMIMLAGVYTLFVVLKNKCEPDVEWLKGKIETAIGDSHVS